MSGNDRTYSIGCKHLKLDDSDEVMTEGEGFQSSLTQLRDDFTFKCPKNQVITGFTSK